MQVLTVRETFLCEFGEVSKTDWTCDSRTPDLKGEMTKEEREALISYTRGSPSEVSV